MSITILKKYENHIDNFIVELSSSNGGVEKYVYRVVLKDLNKPGRNSISAYMFTNLSNAEKWMDALIFGAKQRESSKR